jgi:DNA (cytosine-5)-methyltransferase 1
MNHKFPYKWNLADGYPAKGIEAHGLKVFGTFICGGGSTMGYKLAGFDHIGGVEIDPKVAEVYKVNHNPKHLFIEDIRDFNQRKELPEELYSLDILDGSPPCSSFSMAGNREKDWGKEKVFREGQAKQRLDDLFFDYIALAKRLQPKVVIAENVKGMLQGNAKSYVKKVKKGFEDAGYVVQLFLLNAASMGVPQKRERVFFIGHRKELAFKPLNLAFNERAIPFGEITQQENGLPISGKMLELWSSKNGNEADLGEVCLRLTGKQNYFGSKLQHPLKVSNTIVASSASPLLHSSKPYYVSDNEYKLIGTYPLDYNFKSIEPKYLIGMSVPPVMTSQIASQIYLQWFKTAEYQP